MRVRDQDQVHVRRIGRMQASRLGTTKTKEEVTQIGVGQHPRKRRGEHDGGVTDKGHRDLVGTRVLHPPRLRLARGGRESSGGGAQETQRQGQAGPGLPKAAPPPPVESAASAVMMNDAGLDRDEDV